MYTARVGKHFVRLQEELLTRFDDTSIFAYVSLKPSDRPGPTTLRILKHGNDMVVSEHFDTDMNLASDEEQIVGTVGRYSSSPTYFGEAGKYAPYLVFENWCIIGT